MPRVFEITPKRIKRTNNTVLNLTEKYIQKNSSNVMINPTHSFLIA